MRRTFWTFLAQVLSPGSACRAAVRQAQAQAWLERRPVPREDTSAYCQARLRLPLDRLHELIARVARTLEQRVPVTARWCGHMVKVADGSTVTALDTPANQKAFPQSTDQKPGCGFPLVRLVVLFSLAGGALLGFDTGPYLRSELSLAAGLWALLDAGDVLLGEPQLQFLPRAGRRWRAGTTGPARTERAQTPAKTLSPTELCASVVRRSAPPHPTQKIECLTSRHSRQRRAPETGQNQKSRAKSFTWRRPTQRLT